MYLRHSDVVYDQFWNYFLISALSNSDEHDTDSMILSHDVFVYLLIQMLRELEYSKEEFQKD